MRRMYSLEQLKKVAQEVASSGELKNVKIYEEIVDKNGNKRFTGGNLTETEETGVTHKYAKWVLSGTHLMIVDAVSIVPDKTIAAYFTFASILNMPSWILAKIFPIGTETDWVIVKNVEAYNEEGVARATLNKNFMLRKTENGLLIYCINGIDTTGESQNIVYRFAVDIVIDDD